MTLIECQLLNAILFVNPKLDFISTFENTNGTRTMNRNCCTVWKASALYA